MIQIAHAGQGTLVLRSMIDMALGSPFAIASRCRQLSEQALGLHGWARGERARHGRLRSKPYAAAMVMPIDPTTTEGKSWHLGCGRSERVSPLLAGQHGRPARGHAIGAAG